MVILAGLAVGVLFGFAGGNDSVQKVIATGGSTYLVIIAGGYAALILGGRPSGRDSAIVASSIGNQRGVLVPYSAALFRWTVALMAATAVGFAILLPVLLIVPDLAKGAFGVLAVLAGLVAVPLCGWFVIDVLRQRIVSGYLLLTPQGVHHRNGAQEEFMPWDSILQVAAEHWQGPTITLYSAVNGVQRRFTSRIALRRAPAMGPTKISARALAVDPAVAYHILTYYRANPSARSELATAAALQRVRTRRLL